MIFRKMRRVDIILQNSRTLNYKRTLQEKSELCSQWLTDQNPFRPVSEAAVAMNPPVHEVKVKLRIEPENGPSQLDQPVVSVLQRSDRQYRKRLKWSPEQQIRPTRSILFLHESRSIDR